MLTHTRKRIAAALSAGLIAVLLVPSAASADAAAPVPCSNSRNMEQVSLRTFNIDAKVVKPAYRIGQTAVFKVTVVRPADGDPMNLGVPMDGVPPQPAPDINVGVGLLVGDVFLPGFAITDENGKATVKVKIESYAQPAVVDAAFYAWKVAADSPCAKVMENGFRAYPEMFTVK